MKFPIRYNRFFNLLTIQNGEAYYVQKPPISDHMLDSINHLLPFVLNPHNIARYDAENSTVLIGDRRKYPLEKTFVRCETVEAVAIAIEQMVTQGAGPWQAAACGLALAARQADTQSPQNALSHIRQAQQRLIATRPTNTALRRRLELCMAAVEQNSAETTYEQAILNWLHNYRTKIYTDYAKRGRYGADLIADGDGISTMCFAETAFVLAMAMAHEDGKNIHVYVPETRPYLQGAKLTAPCLHELGIPVTLIGDNMSATLMAQGKIQKYFTAADLITLDGHVVNKVGTYQHAIAAKQHGVPYFAFAWGLDKNRPNRDSVEIEYRNPEEIKQFRGEPTTDPSIKAIYPAFDITPPHLVAGVITKQGVFSAYDLSQVPDLDA